ncbi:uncharacterized protein LOC115438735 [Sphaeramia orbicularis]|uniref:Uncharacterized LOC115438735 n=1 Tax=Sphaeramia orbicularis TaxID=375764 RepID=A0A673CHV2_9TELE|nr:uncharacterized protein LOC115438735 [Sphaeramia orbicularis]
MINFSLVTFLLFCFTSVIFSQLYTVDIQPGEEITLQCTNYTILTTHIYWFQMTHRFNASCISWMMTSNDNVSFCEGFQTEKEKYEMASNMSNIFLTINNVDLSDTGLYFCGEKRNDGKAIMASAIYLNVQDPDSKLPVFISVILCCVIIFLIVVIIVLLNKIRTVHNEEHNPQHREDLNSEALNYAALNIRPQPRRNRQEEPNVIYAATRLTH